MRNFIILISSIVLLSSCSSTNYTYRDNFIQDKPVITSEVVVDVKLDVNKKVESTSSKRKTVELAKNEAYYKAITENNIDVVVDPIFEVKTSDKILFFGGRSTAKLKGFAGYYVNPRTKVEAIKELKLVDTLDIHKYNNIYMGIPFPVINKIKVKTENVKVKSSTVSLDSGMKSVVPNKTESKELKSNFGFKIAKATNNLDVANYGEYANDGISFGFIYESNPNGKFGLRTEFLYSINDEFDHIYIPVLGKYSFTKNFSILLGPSITHIMGDDFDEFADISLGLDYGISYDIGKKIFIDLRFSNGLNDIGEFEEIKYKSNTIGIGYRF
ncbi:hypothetical protein [Flavobacterium sp.]|uniref:hypothetical protein n=1 Tax=Flavobacterium sp. TaxID=239 RepID=UPI0035AD96CF